MAGESSTLEVLLTASDYEGFLTRLELLSKTTKHDRQLMKSLQDDIAKLNDTKELLSSNQQEVKAKQTAVESEKADIVSSKTQVQSLYNTVDSKQSTLEKQVAQRNAYISSLSAGSKELENENKKYRLRKTATIKACGTGEKCVAGHRRIAKARRQYRRKRGRQYGRKYRWKYRRLYGISQGYDLSASVSKRNHIGRLVRLPESQGY